MGHAMLFDPGQKERSARNGSWLRRRASALTIAGRERAAPQPRCSRRLMRASVRRWRRIRLSAGGPSATPISICGPTCKIDVRETSFFDTLVDAGDLIEGALKDAAGSPETPSRSANWRKSGKASTRRRRKSGRSGAARRSGKGRSGGAWTKATGSSRRESGRSTFFEHLAYDPNRCGRPCDRD